MKLVIQIPCLNESEHLPETLADLPRQVDGVDEIVVLVIDDGSADETSAVAAAGGAHHIVRFPRQRGLAAAFMAGIDASLRLGADVIVNTDADNQYRGADIGRVVAPILHGRADVVIGDRQTDRIPHFSAFKRWMQRWGSRVVRSLSGTGVSDATSGFRAYSRQAAYQIFVHNRFTYTLETIIQGGSVGLAFEDVKLETNPYKRASRLSKSIADYVLRGSEALFRAYGMYRPARTFGLAAALLFACGVVLCARFAFIYASHPTNSGHTQSLVAGVGFVILSFLVALASLLGEMLAANRRLLEDVLTRIRRLDSVYAQEALARGELVDGIRNTGAPPWRREGRP